MLTHGNQSSHQHTRYDAKTHTVVSPAAAQLIQTLTTINSPHFTGSPSPRITQRRWALSGGQGARSGGWTRGGGGGTREGQEGKYEKRIY